jgi:hypothetical protein
VWLPPVAEAITYHYVHPADMVQPCPTPTALPLVWFLKSSLLVLGLQQLMTNYVNQRWQYEPNRRGNFSTFLAVSPSLMKNTDWEALARKH